MSMKLLLLFCSLLLLFTGCYYDHADEIYGSAGCDATNITYTLVAEIMSRNGCTGCHTGTGASGGIRLDSYTAVKAKVTDGRLWGSINHLSGFSPMPQSTGKMAACDLLKIRKWIDSGTPQ